MLKYCLDRYKTQTMRDEFVDDCLSALKFVSELLVTDKMTSFMRFNSLMMTYSFLMKILVTSLFLLMKWVFLVCVDHDKIKLEDIDFYQDDPETIIHVRLLAWRDKLENCKSYKKSL